MKGGGREEGREEGGGREGGKETHDSRKHSNTEDF